MARKHNNLGCSRSKSENVGQRSSSNVILWFTRSTMVTDSSGDPGWRTSARIWLQCAGHPARLGY